MQFLMYACFIVKYFGEYKQWLYRKLYITSSEIICTYEAKLIKIQCLFEISLCELEFSISSLRFIKNKNAAKFLRILVILGITKIFKHVFLLLLLLYYFLF